MTDEILSKALFEHKVAVLKGSIRYHKNRGRAAQDIADAARQAEADRTSELITFLEAQNTLLRKQNGASRERKYQVNDTVRDPEEHVTYVIVEVSNPTVMKPMYRIRPEGGGKSFWVGEDDLDAWGEPPALNDFNDLQKRLLDGDWKPPLFGLDNELLPGEEEGNWYLINFPTGDFFKGVGSTKVASKHLKAIRQWWGEQGYASKHEERYPSLWGAYPYPIQPNEPDFSPKVTLTGRYEQHPNIWQRLANPDGSAVLPADGPFGEQVRPNDTGQDVANAYQQGYRDCIVEANRLAGRDLWLTANDVAKEGHHE